MEELLGRIFWKDFFGKIFWEKFFGRNFLGRFFWGGILWEEFFVYIVKVKVCLSYLSMEGIDLFVKILVFVKILSQGKKENFNP